MSGTQEGALQAGDRRAELRSRSRFNMVAVLRAEEQKHEGREGE